MDQEKERTELFYAVITILVQRLGGKVEISSADLLASQNTPGSITKTPDGIIVEAGK